MEKTGGEEPGLIDAFLSTYDRYQTREAYGHDLRDFFGEGELAPSDLRRVSPEKVGAYLQETESENGPTAARRRGAALRSIYRWAEGEEIVRREKARAIYRASEEALD